MGALWAAGDAIKRERMNRIFAAVRMLGMPMYDVDNSNVVQVASVPHDGVALTGSPALIGPNFSALVTQVQSITLANADVSPRTAHVALAQGSGGFTVANTIWDDVLKPGERVQLEGPWFVDNGGGLIGYADSAGLVGIRAEKLTWAAQPSGLTLKVINGIALTSVLSTHYTCPGSKDAILLSATYCNTDTAIKIPYLFIVHSGDAAGVANLVHAQVLQPHESTIIGGHLLKPGDTLQGLGSVAGVIGARFTVLEVDQ